VRFLWAKGLSAMDIRKEIFHVYGWKCLSSKAIHSWVENVSLKTERLKGKWLRQQWKYLYPVDFDALVKQWDKCINVGVVYVEK
jgi:hypothetical protein